MVAWAHQSAHDLSDEHFDESSLENNKRNNNKTGFASYCLSAPMPRHLTSTLFLLLLPRLPITMVASLPSSKGLPFPVMQAGDDNCKMLMQDDGTIRSVPTKMNYVTPDTIKIDVRRDVSGCDSIYEGAKWDAVTVAIHNARACGTLFTLEEHGFELQNSPVSPDIDFMDTEGVIDQYYPACESLLRSVLGKDKVATVKAFDHNIRISSDDFGPNLKKGGQAKAQVPLGIVHGDYTQISGPKRLDDLGNPPKANDVLKHRLGEKPLLDSVLVEDSKNGKRRFALINVWRNIDVTNPVKRSPLAIVDAKSVKNDDLKVLKIHYKDRIGQNYFASHNIQHQWYYFPQLMNTEALLIKQWDSFGNFALNDQSGSGRSTFALHSAFLDPTTSQDDPPRKSIEVRCAVIWEEEDNEH